MAASVVPMLGTWLGAARVGALAPAGLYVPVGSVTGKLDPAGGVVEVDDMN